MFGPGGFGAAMRARDNAMSLPTRDVTPAEFREAAAAAGWTVKEVEFHMKLQKGLGSSSVVVGSEKLAIIWPK